ARDWLVLAMCQYRLGHQERARSLLAYALPRGTGRADDTEGLAEFREEALALIGPSGAPATAPVPGAPEGPAALTLVLEIDRKAGWAYAMRGVACARLKQWDQAAADHARALEARPDNHRWWHDQAAARLGAGDRLGYCRVRTEFLKRFRDTKDSVA